MYIKDDTGKIGFVIGITDGVLTVRSEMGMSAIMQAMGPRPEYPSQDEIEAWESENDRLFDWDEYLEAWERDVDELIEQINQWSLSKWYPNPDGTYRGTWSEWPECELGERIAREVKP